MPAAKTAPAPASGRRHAPPEARRAQILAAALHCFADKGYHAARMDDLARASGLSKGSLYWHFRGKEDVFLALFDALEAEVFAAWEDEAAHATDALALLRREGEIVIERMAGQRTLVGAWMEFLAHPVARERMRLTYERSRERLAALLRRGLASREIREGLPPEAGAALLTGAVEGLVLQAFVDADFDPLAAWSRAWPALERGLAR